MTGPQTARVMHSKCVGHAKCFNGLIEFWTCPELRRGQLQNATPVLMGQNGDVHRPRDERPKRGPSRALPAIWLKQT